MFLRYQCSNALTTMRFVPSGKIRRPATDGSVRLLLQNGDDIQLPGSARLASSIPKTGPADSHRLRRPTQKPSEFRRLGLSGCHIPPPSPPNLADEPKLHCAAIWKA
jgi:hypothetical protein